MTDLSKLDAANRAVQASTMSKVGKVFDAEATAAIHALDARLAALEKPVVVPPPVDPGGARVSVRDRFGGDIRAALLSGEKRLYVAPGTYAHSDVLPVNGQDILFDTVTVTATNGTRSALMISGASPVVRFQGACKLVCPGPAPHDQYAVEAMGIVIGSYGWGTSNVTLAADALTVSDPWAAGVFVHDTRTAVISGAITVARSGRDSFHTTGGSTDIDWQAALVAQDSGDDGAAVVSYGGEPVCERVRYRNVTVKGNQVNGRGVSCVGGKYCSVDWADISDTAAAGVYAACEPEYNSHEVDGWTVNAKVRRPNRKGIHPSNVVVYSGVAGKAVRNVTVKCDGDPAFPLVSKPGPGLFVNVTVTP